MFTQRDAWTWTTACRAFAVAAALFGVAIQPGRADESEGEIARWLQDAEDEPVIAEPPSQLSPPAADEEMTAPSVSPHDDTGRGAAHALAGDFAPPDLRCLNPNYQPRGPEDDGFWDF